MRIKKKAGFFASFLTLLAPIIILVIVLSYFFLILTIFPLRQQVAQIESETKDLSEQYMQINYPNHILDSSQLKTSTLNIDADLSEGQLVAIYISTDNIQQKQEIINIIRQTSGPFNPTPVIESLS